MASLAKFARVGLQLGNITTSALRATPTRQWRSFHIGSFLAAERRFTDKHEWVTLDGIIATVGISNYAQEALGDVVFAQLPDPGTALKQDDECGALESVKAASEVYSPVSGKVMEKNTNVEEIPGLLNSDCYEKGWLFKVQISDPAEIEKLMTEKQYEEFLKEAEH